MVWKKINESKYRFFGGHGSNISNLLVKANERGYAIIRVNSKEIYLPKVLLGKSVSLYLEVNE